MTGITADGPGGVAVLAAEVERLRRLVADAGQAATYAKVAAAHAGAQIDGVRGDVAALQSLRTQVLVLAQRVTELATRTFDNDELAGLVSWFDATTEQAEQLLDALAFWLADVAVRYQPVRVALSDCWFRHPAAVDALNALRLAWFAAYRSPQASASAAVDWHVRLLPGIADLVELELRGCSEASHGPDGEVPGLDGLRSLPSAHDPRLSGHARWWTSGRRAAAEADTSGTSSG